MVKGFQEQYAQQQARETRLREFAEMKHVEVEEASELRIANEALKAERRLLEDQTSRAFKEAERTKSEFQRALQGSSESDRREREMLLQRLSDIENEQRKAVQLAKAEERRLAEACR